MCCKQVLGLKCFVDVEGVVMVMVLDLKCLVDIVGVVSVIGLNLKCLVDVKRSNVGDGS